MRGPLGVLFAATLLLGGPLQAGAAAPPPQGRVPLPLHVPAFTESAPRLGPAPPQAVMQVGVWLQDPQATALAALAQEVYTPGSPQYGRFLTPAEVDARFAPPPAARQAVQQYLASQGLATTAQGSNPFYIAATGTAAQVEAAFGVDLQRYIVEGQTVVANSDAPSLPPDVAADVAAVSGLDGAAVAHPDVAAQGGGPHRPLPAPNRPPTYAQLCAALAPDNGATVSGATYVSCPYDPAGLAAAIGLSGHLPMSGPPAGFGPGPLRPIGPGAGGGRAIAIVDAYGSPTVGQDLRLFDRTFHLPPARVRQIGATTYSPTSAASAGWNAETELDVEWAHAIDPSAPILLYIAPDSGSVFESIAQVVARGAAPVLSISWGLYESSVTALPQGSALLDALNTLFEAAALEGIGVDAAAGDCGNGAACTGAATVDFPASSPWVTAVGGVSLLPGGTVTPWGTAICTLSVATPPPVPVPPCSQGFGFAGGGGGGYSAVFQAPPWQRQVTGSPMRALPDVSLDADPYTGVWMTLDGGFLAAGGTSLATPVFAGLMALADRAAGAPLGLATPYLYGLPASDHVLRDVGATTAGPLLYFGQTSRNLYEVGFGEDAGLSAGPGWDDATGLGVPSGGALLRAVSPVGHFASDPPSGAGAP